MNKDTIYRQEAIEAISDWFYDCDDARSVNQVLSGLPSARQDLTEEDWRLIRQLRSYHNGTYAKVLDKLIASAQPERKTGTWVFVRGEEAGNALYMCSECGKGDIHAPEVRVPYCWNCGAQMEGSDAN